MRAGFERARQSGDGSLGDFAQMGFELGIGFFDWIEVWAVRRQIAQFGSGGLYKLFDARPLVGGQIVHHDDIARRERGNEARLHPRLERGGVDRLVAGRLRHEARESQTGDEGDRFVVAVRDGGAQPSSTPAAPVLARKIGRRAGFVDEDELCRIEIELSGKPRPSARQNVRTLLFFGVRGLFLSVMSWRSKKRHSTDEENRSP